jgi:phosphoribosylanthranilate isomerase
MSDRNPGAEAPFSPPKVKICGLTRREDAVLAWRAGADFLGVVLVPDTPRYRTPQEAGRILRDLPVQGVVVGADLSPEEAASSALEAGASVVQLHGGETPEVVARVREAGPWRVWKACRVRHAEDVREALNRYADAADGLLLDGWHPNRLGGSGRTFSWADVAGADLVFPEHLIKILAGGMSPANVVEAVNALRPKVVDVSSGVEKSLGIKDAAKVTQFIERVRKVERGGGS